MSWFGPFVVVGDARRRFSKAVCQMVACWLDGCIMWPGLVIVV